MEFKDINNKGRKKIVLIIPNLGKGGAQQVFRQQFKFLSKSFDVTRCVFNWDGSFQEERIDGIVSLDVPAGKTIFGKIWYFLLRIRKLRNLKREIGADVTISHLEGADYINVLTKINDKTICWVHGTKMHDENIEGGLGVIRKSLLIPYLYRRASKIVAVSKGISDELGKNYSELKPKLLTIYNGFDIENIIERSKESVDDEFTTLFTESKIIITHCRLSRQKNLFALVKVFNGLKRDSDVKLVIIGDGELRNDLLVFCKSIQLKYWAIWDDHVISNNSDVYFLGHQSNPFKFLRHAHVFSLTSGWEGFPLALCEAIVCGVKVLAADCFTGPREIIAPEIDLPQPLSRPYRSQHGTLMPLVNISDNDSQSIWIKEIEDALNKPKLNESQINGGKIEKFNISNTNAQTANLIHQLTL